MERDWKIMEWLDSMPVEKAMETVNTDMLPSLADWNKAYEGTVLAAIDNRLAGLLLRPCRRIIILHIQMGWHLLGLFCRIDDKGEMTPHRWGSAFYTNPYVGVGFVIVSDFWQVVKTRDDLPLHRKYLSMFGD